MKKRGATPSTREGILKHQHTRFLAMGGRVKKADILPSVEMFRKWQVKDDFGR